MDIPVRVKELAETLAAKGFTPVGYGEMDELYVVQIAEQG